MKNVKEVLADRSPQYGPYGDQVMVRREIVDTIMGAYASMHDEEMAPKHQEYLWDIANKLSRIACTPTHQDSWRDIGGYAELILKDIRKDEADADR